MIRWLIPLLLVGCATPAPTIVRIPQPVEVMVQVPVTCVAEVPPRPALVSDPDLFALPDYALVLTLRKEQLLYRAYTAELEALLGACAEVIP